jgi:lipopolysaccharide transport system ATP-binding protein
MSAPVIIAAGLGKQYRIERRASRWRFDTLAASLTGMVKRLAGGPAPEIDTLWALRDVGFEIAAGEVVGMIGHNGAGKSTLLKILSRITAPTAGLAEIEGTVGSLLEVGTGFHPELTGRENIYLNGAILGMKRADISARFDEIVAFAETEAFLETPLKKYSSGMYLRLAFAVAAHLQPDILIVDEVLAVGDAAFQRKCLGKMGDVAKQGRTVLFVSHNMGAVRSLCKRGLVFNGGRLEFDGRTDEAISYYLTKTAARAGDDEGLIVFDESERDPAAELSLRAIRLTDSVGQVRGFFDAGEAIRVEIDYEVHARVRGMRAMLQLTTQEGEQAFVSTDHAGREPEQPPGRYRTTCVVPGGLLNRRLYLIAVGAPDVRDLGRRQPGLDVSRGVAGRGVSDAGVEDGPGALRDCWRAPRLARAALSLTLPLRTGGGDRKDSSCGQRGTDERRSRPCEMRLRSPPPVCRGRVRERASLARGALRYHSCARNPVFNMHTHRWQVASFATVSRFRKAGIAALRSSSSGRSRRLPTGAWKKQGRSVPLASMTTLVQGALHSTGGNGPRPRCAR